MRTMLYVLLHGLSACMSVNLSSKGSPVLSFLQDLFLVVMVFYDQ